MGTQSEIFHDRGDLAAGDKNFSEASIRNEGDLRTVRRPERSGGALRTGNQSRFESIHGPHVEIALSLADGC